MVHFQGVRSGHMGVTPLSGRASKTQDRRAPCDATTSTISRPFETSRKRRRGLCLGNAGAARRPRRARREGAEREARPQRPVPVRLGPAVSRSAACAPAASTAASGIITSAIRARPAQAAGPRPRCGSGEWRPGPRGFESWLVSRFRSSPEFAARSDANFGIEGH